MIKENLATIDEDGSNFVNFDDRYLFIVKKPIMVGSNKDNPAWMYLGYDRDHANEEQRSLHKKAKKKHLSDADIVSALQREGLFGVISGQDYPIGEILPAYYQRQSIEQIFDFTKHYTKLLPLRVESEETLRGHLLLSYIAACSIKMIQLRLKADQMMMGSRLECMSMQHCNVYQSRIVIDPADAIQNESYEACGIACPTSIFFKDGRLAYQHADSLSLPPEKKKRKPRSNKTADTSEGKPKKPGKRGRPKGSKNKKTLEREAALKASGEAPTYRGPGRPKGSKNKKTLEREAALAAQAPRHRGRPKGSKNKKTLEREARAATDQKPTS
jgi:hypothetical protein